MKHFDILQPEFYYYIIYELNLLFRFLSWNINERFLLFKELSLHGLKVLESKFISKVDLDTVYRANKVRLKNFLNSFQPEVKLKQKQLTYFTNLSIYLEATSKKHRVEKIKILLHMHLNRLFAENNLYHEAICYYWLYKTYLSACKQEKKDLTSID